MGELWILAMTLEAGVKDRRVRGLYPCQHHARALADDLDQRLAVDRQRRRPAQIDIVERGSAYIEVNFVTRAGAAVQQRQPGRLLYLLKILGQDWVAKLRRARA